MRGELIERVRNYRASNTVLAGISFIIVATLTGIVVAAALLDELSGSTASLIISAILAVATFGYVLLTFSMASTMQQQADLTAQALKLQQKPDIVKIIEEDIHPRLTDITTHRDAFNASDIDAYDEYQIDENTFVERFPELENGFDSPEHAAVISDEVDVNAGDIYMYYEKVREYRELYNRAVTEVEVALVEQASDSGPITNHSRDYAQSVLALEPCGEIPRHAWRESRNDVMQTRLEITDREQDLHNLKSEIKNMGHDLRQELGQAEANLRQEYNITRADV